jgi:hypothetical protein
MTPKNQVRTVRYRRLALAEPDKAKAAILNHIADEAERDVLCTMIKWTAACSAHLGNRVICLERAYPRRERSTKRPRRRRAALFGREIPRDDISGYEFGQFCISICFILKPKEVDMAKGQQRSNREVKKPKKKKIKVIAAAPSQKGTGLQPTFAEGKRK